jgi:hypothetical protein
MSAKPDASKVLEEALLLDNSARAFVAEALLESLDIDEDFTVSDQWLAEVRRRCADIDSGKSELLVSENVINELRGKYSR